jgi:hypothetical protein
MLRYHKKVYIDQTDLERLKTFTEGLNSLSWAYTDHCLDNIKSRAIDLEGLLGFIKGIILDYNTIFEFYAEEQTREIIKVCYRINWQKDLDIILVIGKNKQIITIYLNSSDDLHYTLRKEAYTNE